MNYIRKLGFIYRAFIGIKDNFLDNPKIINEIIPFFSGEEFFVYKFGNGKEPILYIGGIHGNEVGTVKLMYRWINYLYSNKEIIPSNKSIYIIPCLNIYGYNKALLKKDYLSGGTIGKTNGNDVDLNRNFPTSNWKKNTKLFVSGKYYDISGGKSAGSELEIKNLLKFVKNYNIKSIYMFHSCWGTVMGTFTNKTDLKVKEYSKISNYKIFNKSDWNNLKEIQKTGHGTVWAIENNLEFIEIELKTRWGSEWKKNKKALINSLEL